MSGNVEDRWIWKGSRPVTSTSTTQTSIIQNISQEMSTRAVNLTSDSGVLQSFFSSQLNKSQIQNHTTVGLTNILQNAATTTITTLWNGTPESSNSSVSPNKTTVEQKWDGGPVDITNNATIDELLASINVSPTLPTILGINSERADVTVNMSGTAFPTLEWRDVPTPTWTLPPDELTRSSSHVKNIHGYAFTNSTEDSIQGLDSSAGTYYVISYAVVCVMLLLLMVSILANSIIFFTITCRSYLRRTYFVLYLSLAISDLMASVFMVPVVVTDIIKPKYMPLFPPCPLVVAAMVLANYVSVGTICSICTIRWWQFYNFSQTRRQEKLAIRFFTLFLWTTGSGIYFGLVFQDIVKADGICTLNGIVTVLKKTLPLTSISVSVGFIIVCVVNYLTIKKVQQKSIYHDLKGSRSRCFNYMHRFLDWKVKFHYVKDNESSDVNTLDGYSVHETKDISDKRNEVINEFYEDLGLKTATNEKLSIDPTVWNVGLSIPSTSEKHPMSGEGFEAMERIRTPVPPSADGDSISQQKFRNDIDKHPQKNKNLTALPLNSMSYTNGIEHVLQGPPYNASNLLANDTDLESEHISEVTEPTDVQEVMPQNNCKKFPIESHAETLPIPNTVENFDNINAVIMRETTIHNAMSVPPENHTVNTFAWKIKKICESLPSLAVAGEPSGMQTLQPQENSDICRQTLVRDSTNNEAVKETTVAHSPTPSTNENLLDSNDPKQSSNIKPFFPLINNDDSNYAGYMADLSATSSMHNTPHRKLSVEQRTQRLSALSTSRAVSQSSEESASVSSTTPSPARTPTGKRPNQESCSPVPVSSATTNPEKRLMHPVRLKCVRISRHLVALFTVAYLPLMTLQILASMISSLTVFYTFIIYMSLLLAMHPSLYGLQSPILKNAIRKLGKKRRCSVQPISGNQQKLCHIYTVQNNAKAVQPSSKDSEQTQCPSSCP